MLYIGHCSLEKWLFIQISQSCSIAIFCSHHYHYWLRDETPFFCSSNNNVWCCVSGAILGFCPLLFHLT
ncbi:hypothetical protein CR513_57815, partial [Mucuna pruriens]